MKKLISLLTICAFFNACETDFDVTSDWREIPVVYGILDASKTTQYIKINKAFLGEVDALQAAQVADSLYFSENMEVYLKAFKFTSSITADNFNYNTNINYAHSDKLERVSLASEGIPKEEGTFENDPAYVYKYTRELDEEYGYVLEFTTPGGNLTRAFTPIVESFRITKPDEDQNFNLEILNNNTEWELRWNKADFATTFDVTFKLDYLEAPSNDTDNRVGKSVYWTPVRNFGAISNSVGTNFYTTTVSKEAFYQYLNSVIEKKEGVIRILGDIEITINGASQEMQDYISANAEQTGIASGQLKPEYSNIDGGIGLFTSANKTTIIINQFSNVDKWACELDLIKQLNFTPPVTSPNFPFCD